MRTRQEILEYLNLPEDWSDVINVEKVIETAQRIEQEYEEELLEGSVGYGLECDFESMPYVLEDCDIEKIAAIDGIVVYRKLEATTRFYVCGIGYDDNEKVTDYEVDFGNFDTYEEAYALFVRLQCKKPEAFFNGVFGVNQLLIQLEECEETDEEITCVDVKNEWWVTNPMKNWTTYSDFCLWVSENDDQVEWILEYDDWSVVLIGDRYYYYEHEIEGESDTFFVVEPIAQLVYNAINDVQENESGLHALFECDMSGEQVCDDKIIYWWFKEVK